ncbi:MAG: flagellar biosynthesis anti-sigma factor FlgM [Deltaproteobacteria bacterium]|nr:flagellar biosynthesis anti-sigma factor FlgM [Deltaproteobacteria bacterium]
MFGSCANGVLQVAELKEQIENGTYEMDAEKIADKMLKDSLFNDLT